MIALATVDIATAETDHLVAGFVTDGDRHASARHKLRRRQRQGLAARALVRSLLTKYFDHAADCWHLTYDANGKPAAVLADNSRHIALSISHSKDLVACAMTNLGPDSDTCGVLYHQEDLLKVPLRIEDGFSYPPEGPGLGVEIDMKIFESWKAAAAVKQ